MTKKILVPKRTVSRKSFLKTASVIGLTAFSEPGLFFFKRRKRNKMILSFYLDDTSPYNVKAEAYKDFLDYCHVNGIKGESSVILAFNGKSMLEDPDENQSMFLRQAKLSFEKGIDSHMEIMTHQGLYDFRAGKAYNEGVHEGLWLHEPAVKVSEYQKYFLNIINEAQKAGIKFTGLTWPGCSCEACTRRYAELSRSGPLHISDSAFQALLNLAKKGKFRRPVISVFYDSSETEFGIFCRASDGKYGVYDLMPNAKDYFGIWSNARDHVDPDYYISEDGQSGIIIQHLKNDVPYCMWYMHWQGLNPERGVGWDAFVKVNERIKKYLKDQVVWMQPGDIVRSYHNSGGWDFTGNL